MYWDLLVKCLHVSVYLVNPKKLCSIHASVCVVFHGCSPKPAKRNTHPSLVVLENHACQLSSYSRSVPVRYTTLIPTQQSPDEPSFHEQPTFSQAHSIKHKQHNIYSISEHVCLKNVKECRVVTLQEQIDMLTMTALSCRERFLRIPAASPLMV